jgi:hypothetical protein
MMESLPDRLPLVIGVTGHRDLRDSDIPRLENEIAAIIRRLRRDYLARDGETPIVVLSALAEGGDRLAARIALAQGARLIAPMPMPIEEYRRDFEPGLKPGNAVEFDELLSQALAAPVVPFAPGNSLEAVQSDGKRRAEQYRAVGMFIVQHCHVLIALWDGDERDMAVGGTAEVVKFKREGIPIEVSHSARSSLDASEIGPVIHVVAPRSKADSPAKQVTVHPWGYELTAGNGARKSPPDRDHEAWQSFEALVRLTCRFNREAATLDAASAATTPVQKNIDLLFETADKTQPGFSAGARQRALAWAPRWSRLYGLGDTLAQAQQRRFHSDWWWLFVLGSIALLLFELKTHIFYQNAYSDLLLVGYSALLASLFVVLSIARRRQHQERFLDYRALAEALRVAIFWKLVDVGMERRGAAALPCIAEAYPIKQTGELAWVKVSLRTLELLDTIEPAAPAPRALDPDGYAWARDIWVAGQLDFFRNKGHRHNETAERRERISFGLLGASILLVLSLLVLSRVAHWHHGDWSYDVTIFCIGALPGLAAALVGYSEQLALKAQARQYDRMSTLFERAFSLLPDQLGKIAPVRAQDIFSELGREAMKENAEWVAIYRQRPIRPPQG